MSPVAPPNYESDNAKIVSSAGSNTMQIPDDNVSPPYHHVRTRKSPSQYRRTRNIPIYTKHTSSKKTSSARQHAASVKSNPVHVRSSVPVVNWSPLSYRYSIHRSSPTITVLAYSMPVPRQRDPLLLDQTALKNATLLQD